jgi:hypothetical protein
MRFAYDHTHLDVVSGLLPGVARRGSDYPLNPASSGSSLDWKGLTLRRMRALRGQSSNCSAALPMLA